MPSRGRKFITEFLLPSLNEKKFGPRLMWLDIEKKVFQIQWNHKSASDWTTSHAAVFAAWDKKKGHYKPDDKEYYSKSKQRFRAALYKFIKHKHITELYSEDKYTKIYCIGEGQNISGTSITTAKSENENEVKQNPEDLVLNWNSNWNEDLLIQPQENSLVACDNEMVVECFHEEQVVTDEFSEFIPGSPHSETSQNEIRFQNSSSGENKYFSTRKTSNVWKGDLKSLYFMPKTNISKEDKLLKVVTITNDNGHDYLYTIMDTSIQMEWNHLDGTDEDLSCQFLNTYDC